MPYTKSKHTDELRKQLEKIGWTLEDRGCEHYAIVDNNGKSTGFMHYGDRIERRDGNYKFNVYFDLNHCNYIYYKDFPKCLTIGVKRSKHIFIHFYNFEDKEED